MAALLETIMKDLEAAEKQLADNHMIVLAKTKSGEAREMTVDECIESGAEFVKVIRGNNQGEFDRIMCREFNKVMSEYQASVKTDA